MAATEPGALIVGPLADLDQGSVVSTTAPTGLRVAVFNIDGDLYALEDRCSHQEARLSDGFIDGCAVECPLHAASFNLKTGEPDGLPATKPVRTFPVRVEAGQIVVEID